MEIVILEDNKKFNERINRILNKVLIENNSDIKVISFYDFNNNLEDIIYNEHIKIYILDVELPSKSGYDIARLIRNSANDWKSFIIISSAHNMKESFISQMFSIFTYISKFDNFNENLETVFSTVLKIISRDNTITIVEDNIEYNISPENILYIIKEIDSRYCIIKTFDDEFRIRKPLSSFKMITNLTRIKRYLLVNKKNTISISNKEIIFKNNQKIRL